MQPQTYELFRSQSSQDILDLIQTQLQQRNESPFWKDKVIPFSEAILSILIPLREDDMLFDPQGDYVAELTPELFFEWSDFVSLKMLAFTIQKSNAAKSLQRTNLPEEKTKNYKEIDLSILGGYLSRYSVNLKDELLDFPIANYNLHQGVSNVIKSFL
jgi:hypothetical protein